MRTEVAHVDNIYLVAAAWMGIALAASLVSIRLGISVALIEIAFGVLAGNFAGLHTTTWIDFLATFGSGLLTFLAGAEIDPEMQQFLLLDFKFRRRQHRDFIGRTRHH